MTEVLFTDMEFVKNESDIKGRFAPGSFVYGISEGLLTQSTMQKTGYAFLNMELDMKGPAFVGDTIHVECEVIEARLSNSRPGRRLVRTFNKVVKQDGTVVMTYAAAHDQVPRLARNRRQQMKGLKEKVVIVTGGCGGIGRRCASVSRRKAKVAIFDLNAEGAGRLPGASRPRAAWRLLWRGISPTTRPSRPPGPGRKRAGPVDVGQQRRLGPRRAAPCTELPLRQDRQYQPEGPINPHDAVLKGMVARDEGSIVNVSSDAGRVGSSASRSTWRARAAEAWRTKNEGFIPR